MYRAPTISIVAPIYNEVGNIDALYQRISGVMDEVGYAWELVAVNDGSYDGSREALEALYERDPDHVRIVNFARNFGHQIAVTAGMDHTVGEAVILIDADLQDPPELIPRLITRWEEGYEVVYAVRAKRKGESLVKTSLASLFYRVMYRITEIDIPLDTGDFRLMDRSVVDAVTAMPERHRFIRGMVSWVGFRQTGVEYVREERHSGQTKYPLRKQLRFAWDGITGFSHFPLQLATFAGFIIAMLAALTIPVVVYLRAFTDAEPLKGQATTLVVVLFLGGVQLISLGIVGEYLGRIHSEVIQRPLYIIRDTMGVEKQTDYNYSRRPNQHRRVPHE